MDDLKHKLWIGGQVSTSFIDHKWEQGPKSKVTANQFFNQKIELFKIQLNL